MLVLSGLWLRAGWEWKRLMSVRHACAGGALRGAALHDCLVPLDLNRQFFGLPAVRSGTMVAEDSGAENAEKGVPVYVESLYSAMRHGCRSQYAAHLYDPESLTRETARQDPIKSSIGTAPSPQQHRRIRIAIGMPVLSKQPHPCNVSRLVLARMFLRTFFETLDPSEDRFTFHLYLGVDRGDACYDDAAILHELRAIVRAACEETKCASPLYIHMPLVLPNTRGNTVFIWNQVLAAGYAAGAEYLYVASDDNRLGTPGFFSKLYDSLSSCKSVTLRLRNGLRQHVHMSNVGIACPHDDDDTWLCYQELVHRSHFTALGQFYPQVFMQYKADDWISETYSRMGAMFKPVQSSNTDVDGKRYVPCWNWDMVKLSDVLSYVSARVLSDFYEAQIVKRSPEFHCGGETRRVTADKDAPSVSARKTPARRMHDAVSFGHLPRIIAPDFRDLHPSPHRNTGTTHTDDVVDDEARVSPLGDPMAASAGLAMGVPTPAYPPSFRPSCALMEEFLEEVRRTRSQDLADEVVAIVQNDPMGCRAANINIFDLDLTLSSVGSFPALMGTGAQRRWRGRPGGVESVVGFRRHWRAETASSSGVDVGGGGYVASLGHHTGRSSAGRAHFHDILSSAHADGFDFMADRWIVMTTVNPPTRQTLSVCRIRGWNKVVIADLATPIPWSAPGCIFLSVSDQAALRYRIGPLIPFRRYERKIIGYLFALEAGARVIYDTDDDNVQSARVPLVLGETVCATSVKAGDRVAYNAYGHFGRADLWARGLPLDAVKKLDYHSHPVRVRALVQQGLVEMDPDLDAIERLVMPSARTSEVAFDWNATILSFPPETYQPISSQNTVFHYDAFWGLLLPVTTLWREDDIFRGYWVQRLLWEVRGRLVFQGPTAYQIRNPHDFLLDLGQEIHMYKNTSAMLRAMNQWRCDSRLSIRGCIVALHAFLAREGFVGHTDYEMAVAWVSDLASIRYRFPERVGWRSADSGGSQMSELDHCPKADAMPRAFVAQRRRLSRRQLEKMFDAVECGQGAMRGCEATVRDASDDESGDEGGGGVPQAEIRVP